MIDWKLRLRSKVFWVLIFALAYKICQDCGVIISSEQWDFYANIVTYLLMFFGIVIDTSTPGIGDPPKIPTRNSKFGQ